MCDTPASCSGPCVDETRNNGTVGSTPLQQLCQQLKKHFETHREGRNSSEVKKMMQDYVRNHEDWKEYCIYHPAFYARNLVEANEYFELIVLCWQEGQKSPIHNHAGSSCWMACLEGTIEETYYHIVEPDEQKTANGICPNLRKGTSSQMHQGDVGYIHDEIALHVIRPVEGHGVSLHLYSPPIKNCSIYIPALGKVAQKQLGYYTVNKQRCTED